MAINIGENNDKEVTYVNSPDINRVLFKNLSEGASADDIADAVNDWIEEHPEAVTTVQDGSILPVKLDSSNDPSDGYVLSWNATAGKFEWIDLQSDITELKADFSQLSDDIVEYNGKIYGKEHLGYLKPDGTYSSDTTLHSITSEKVNCKSGDTFRYMGYGYVGTTVSCIYYDGDTITGTAAYNARLSPTTITVPDNITVDSVVFSSYGAISSAVVFDVTRLTPKTTKAIVDEHSLELEYPHFYDFADLGLINKKLLNGNTGVISGDDTTSATYWVSDYIEVYENATVSITTRHFYGQGLYAFYDENKLFISGRNSAEGSTVTTLRTEIVNTPSKAKYIVIGYMSNLASFEPCLLVGIPQSIAPSKIWSGKKWACIGDSLTENNIRTTMHYFDYIKLATGITPLNYGVGGSGYAQGTTNFMTKALTIDSTSDVVTFFGSGNDIGALPLGTASDTGTDTIGGCINTALDNVYSVIPTAIIGIITPTPWKNNMPYDNSSMASYSALLVEVAERRSIPVLDLFHCSLLNPNSETFRQLAYSKDDGGGTHPDETGHKIIAPRIKAFLETLII